MSAGDRIETRGIRCLECKGLDLQTYKEQAKLGFGWCLLAELPHFVSAAMARNCRDFDQAPPEVVGPREKWADKLPLFPKRQDND
jgi:hypothetical protein